MNIHMKVLRKKLGVSLDALALKTGMTKSYLSKVERGLSKPSIATALKLSQALNVSVEELFCVDEADQQAYSLVRGDDRQRLASHSEGDESAYVVLTKQVGKRKQLPFMLYPDAEYSGKAFKEHFGEEFMFVHKGTIEVDFDHELITLHCGDSLAFHGQKPHRIRSLGEVQAEVLVVINTEE